MRVDDTRSLPAARQTGPEGTGCAVLSPAEADDIPREGIAAGQVSNAGRAKHWPTSTAPASGLISSLLEFPASDDEVLSVLSRQRPAEKISLAGRAAFGGYLDKLVFGFDTLRRGADTDVLPKEDN